MGKTGNDALDLLRYAERTNPPWRRDRQRGRIPAVARQFSYGGGRVMERRILSVIGVTLLFLGTWPPVLWAGPKAVSADQIHVTGATYFSSEQIAEKLSMSLLSKPELSSKSKADEVREFSEKIVLRNYRMAGFLDVSVQTRVDGWPDTYRIEIEEGDQYLAGDFQVTGLPESEIDTFLAALTRPDVPADSSIKRFRWKDEGWAPTYYTENGKMIRQKRSNWTIGKPVRSADSKTPAIAREVRRAFAAVGRMSGHLDLGELIRDSGSVSCQLEITEFGPQMTGRNLQILGCQKNSPEDVRDYLEIEPNEVLTRKRMEDVRLRLWLSGRFVNVAARSNLPQEPGGTPTVTCELEEYEHAPPLSEPLSESEQVMLKFHKWLSQLPESNDTWHLEFPSQPAMPTCRLTPGQGILAQFENHQLLAHADRIVYCPPERHEKLSVALENRTITVDVTLELPDEDRPKFRLKLGTEILSPDSPSCCVSLRVHADPYACLAMLHAAGTHHSIDNGVLSIESVQDCTKIEMETGRLLEHIQRTEDGKEQLVILHSADDLETACRDLEEEWQEYPDAFIPSAPISSTFRFVAADPAIGEYLRNAARERLKFQLDDRQEAVIGCLLDSALLPTADEMFREWQREQRDDGPKFIAYRESELYSDIPRSTALTAVATVGALRSFPRGTWPHHLIGVVGFSYARSQNLYRYHVAPLQNPPVKSPLCDLLLAEWFKRTRPQSANQLAYRGLGNLTHEAFLSERAVLLDEGHHFGRFMLRVAEVLQDLTDQEAEALMDACFGGPEPGFAAALQYLRAQRDLPAWQVLPDAVEIAWENGWCDVVDSRLMEIIRTTPAPKDRVASRWDIGLKPGKDAKAEETNERTAEAKKPTSRNTTAKPKPLWETLPETKLDPNAPPPKSDFKLQGPFSK